MTWNKIGRAATLIIVLLVATRCGKNRPEWPAVIGSLNGFSDVQKKQVLAEIETWNKLAPTPYMLTEAPKDSKTHYVISFNLVPTIKGDLPNSKRAGHAEIDDQTCQIDLSEILFDGQHDDYLGSVVGHEGGHCAGLVHVEDSSDVMNPVTQAFSLYSKDALSRFIDKLFVSAQLK